MVYTEKEDQAYGAANQQVKKKQQKHKQLEEAMEMLKITSALLFPLNHHLASIFVFE